jgi:hypothetical protein
MARQTNQSTTKHTGIPRTAAEAKKRGYKKIPVDFKTMDAAEKANWVPVGTSKAGALALIRPPSPAPSRYFPGPGGTFICCYYDPTSGQYNLNCHQVPASEVVSPHLEQGST